MGKNKNNNNNNNTSEKNSSSNNETSTTTSNSNKQSTTATTSAAASTSSFKIPKASPIANYADDTLTEREKLLLSKMENMKLYKPKELPKPRLNRNRGWIWVLLEKYNIETALYMIEPWERWILNILLFLFFLLIGYWMVWAYQASIESYNEYVIPTVGKIKEIISSK